MSSSTEDDEYKRATKAVVDDTMRTDVLGPNILKVLKEHSPTSDQIKLIIINAILNDTKVQDALEKFHLNLSLTKRGKGLTHAQSIVINAVITLSITVVGAIVIYNLLPTKK
jgi:response regulator RpfG family c-di-GMP phosphodiesterase